MNHRAARTSQMRRTNRTYRQRRAGGRNPIPHNLAIAARPGWRDNGKQSTGNICSAGAGDMCAIDKVSHNDLRSIESPDANLGAWMQ